MCILQLHQVSSNSDEKQKSFIQNIFNGLVRQLGIGESGLRVRRSVKYRSEPNCQI